MRFDALPAVGRQCDHAVGDHARDAQTVHRIREVVRISPGMHISIPAIGTSRWNTNFFDHGGGIDIPRATGQNSRVACLILQHRNPSDFQFKADYHQHIGLRERLGETGTRVDEMRIVTTASEDRDSDVVATDRLGKITEIRDGGTDPYWLRRSGDGDRTTSKGRNDEEKTDEKAHQTSDGELKNTENVKPSHDRE
jgi:hypothetical protein